MQCAERTARAFPRLSPQQASPISMALLPSFALITYESKKWLQQHAPSLAQQFPAGELDRVTAIRHASKWLGANKKGVDVGLESFRRMRIEHEQRFLRNTPFLWARPLETDLGLYRHRGMEILNTHLLGLILGDQPSDQVGPLLKIATETMVRQATLLSGAHVAGPSFLDGLGTISDRDVRSDKYYSKARRADISVAGYLNVLWCSLAFLRLLKVADPDDEGPVFKLQFAGLFHVVQSLRLLEPELAEGVGDLADGDVARRLRNDLVHYTPHDRTPPEALSAEKPRRRLIEHAYARESGDVAVQLVTAIDDLHARLSKSLGHE